MTINVVKSIMLLVGVLGPQLVLTAVVSSTIASFVLGGVTFLWFQRHNNLNNTSTPPSASFSTSISWYSASIHPCNIAFINYWKAASYTAAVASSIIVLVAHRLDKNQFPLSALTYTLVSTWLLIVLVFSLLCYRFYHVTKERQQLLEDLINYPFYFRSLRESLTLLDEGADTDSAAPPPTPLLISHPRVEESKKHIPGFVHSPWLDSRSSREYLGVDIPDLQGTSLTSELIRYGTMLAESEDHTEG
jgi:hypothetical protein